MIDTEQFGKNLTAILKEKGMSKSHIHRETGISLNTIYGWEYQGRIPRADTLAMVCKVTGVSADRFLEGVVKD